MSKDKEFLDAKEKLLNSLEKAKSENKVDEGIKKILKLLNKSDDYYTSSSCAGRIVLIELPSIGDKKGAVFLGKWHRKVEYSEVWEVAKKTKTGILYLLAQSPIMHVGANTHKAADNLLKTAISCGFKNSGAKSTGCKIIVEICSTERLDSPIGKDGKLFCNEEHLILLVNIANEVLDRSRRKLHRLEDKLEKSFSTRKITQN